LRKRHGVNKGDHLAVGLEQAGTAEKADALSYKILPDKNRRKGIKKKKNKGESESKAPQQSAGLEKKKMD